MVSELTKKQGARLQKLLKERGIKRREIIDKYMSAYGYGSAKVLFSCYCHGTREIPYSLLNAISNELNVEAGYLTGADNFACDSYLEYLER